MQVADAEADLDLMMRIHTNLGITLEAIGLLVSACGHYRWGRNGILPGHIDDPLMIQRNCQTC